MWFYDFVYLPENFPKAKKRKKKKMQIYILKYNGSNICAIYMSICRKHIFPFVCIAKEEKKERKTNKKTNRKTGSKIEKLRNWEIAMKMNHLQGNRYEKLVIKKWEKRNKYWWNLIVSEN